MNAYGNVFTTCLAMMANVGRELEELEPSATPFSKKTPVIKEDGFYLSLYNPTDESVETLQIGSKRDSL